MVLEQNPSSRMLDVRVLQVSFDPEKSAAVHVQDVAEQIANQNDADVVVLPEMWMHGAFAPETWRCRAIGMDHHVIRAIGEAARSSGAYVLAGSFAEGLASNASHPSGIRGLWNTSVLFDRHGDIHATYRKIHRFGFDAGETQYIDAGDNIVVSMILDRAGKAICRVGLATCYDLRFPELFRCLVDAGSEVFLVPAAWPLARLSHWQTLGVARAIENQAFVVQCNDGGSHSGVELGGHSQIVDPLGNVLASTGRGNSEISVTLDLSHVDLARTSFPVLHDRRFGLPALAPSSASA